MSPSPRRPNTIKAYLAALPPDRREAIEALRDVINRNLPKGCEEGMQYGMPAWYVPHSVYPHGYHCDAREPLPFASVASQKSHLGIYLFFAYLDPEIMAWFESEWRKSGCRWDAGKSCVRAKRLEDIPIELVGKVVKKVTVKRFIDRYEGTLSEAVLAKRARAEKPTKKRTTKKASATKKTTGRRA